MITESGSPLPRRLDLGDSVPALIWEGVAAGPRDAIISVHGLGGNKADIHPAFVRTFTSAGLTLVTIDAHRHGDRAPAGLWENGPFTQPGEFAELFARTGQDVVDVVDDLRRNFGIRRVGLRGGSVGGFVVLAAIALGAQVEAVLSVCGGADWEIVSPLALDRDGSETLPATVEMVERADPIRHVDSFPPTPVMLIHGLFDEVVPIIGHQRLYQALAPHYRDHPEDCVFITHAGAHPTPMDLEEFGHQWLIGRVSG